MNPSKEHFIMHNNKNIAASPKARMSRGSYADEKEITLLCGCVKQFPLIARYNLDDL